MLGAACTAGQYSPAGTDTCVDCGINNYCPVLDAGEYECPEGYYSDSPGNAACTACEVGFYCTGGVKAACPYLTYADVEGLNECL